MSEDTKEHLFQEILALAKDLKARGELVSGLQFFIDETGRATAEPLEPDASAVKKFGAIDLPTMAHEALTLTQQTRYALSQHVDVSSATWNVLPIGKALSIIEKELRKETIKIQNHHDGKPNCVYNVLSFGFLCGSFSDLGKLLLSKDFQSSSYKNKVRALDTWALEFDGNNKQRIALSVYSMMAELAILFDQLTAIHGDAIISLRHSVANPHILDGLRSMDRAAAQATPGLQPSAPSGGRPRGCQIG